MARSFPKRQMRPKAAWTLGTSPPLSRSILLLRDVISHRPIRLVLWAGLLSKFSGGHVGRFFCGLYDVKSNRARRRINQLIHDTAQTNSKVPGWLAGLAVLL